MPIGVIKLTEAESSIPKSLTVRVYSPLLLSIVLPSESIVVILNPLTGTPDIGLFKLLN